MRISRRDVGIFLLLIVEMVGGVLLYAIVAPAMDMAFSIQINLDTWIVVCIVLASIHCGRLMKKQKKVVDIHDGVD